jgi:MoxR-like ATPase
VVKEVYIDEKIEKYIVDIVFATRYPEKYGLKELKDLINYGASPRASIYLTLAAKAHAFLRRRGYVTPEDVRSVGMDVMRHRIILSYEAEAEELNTEDVVRKVLNRVEVP